jgi:hypothetical protein
MNALSKATLALLLTFSSATVFASETVTYTYDSTGRMVKVAKSGSINNGIVVDYNFDKAGNRTRFLVSGAGSTSPGGGNGVSRPGGPGTPESSPGCRRYYSDGKCAD